MFEKALHGGNIAAAFAVVATTADVTFTGGAASAITAALSGYAIFKKADPSTKALAKEMAKLMDHELARASLSDGRRRIVTQMLGLYQPSNDDIVQNDMDAGSIADSLCERIKRTAKDPAHKTETALQDLRAVVSATLKPILNRPEVMTELEAAFCKELLSRTKRSGRAERLRDEGITEKAIIRLAQRYAVDTEDVGRAWLELQNAMDVAVRVQQEGRTTSNHGDFVDVVIKRVADLAADGAYGDASAEIDAALEDEDAAHAARKSRLLESGIEIARLDNDPERVAVLLVAKLRMDVAPNGLFDDLHSLFIEWYERGRDGGLNFEASVAIHLAQTSVAIAAGDDPKGAALNDLGAALQTLGERESSTDRLEQAVTAFETALEVRTRNTAPLDWAMTQNNLGIALSILGDRQSGTDMLEQAVTAFTVALKVWTHDNVPLYWARTQNNLGNALSTLGERESGTDRLEQAVTAYTAALQVWRRDTVPLDWATTQNNLGNALSKLGARENGTYRFAQAVTAYSAALKVRTRNTVPLDWAMTQNNLGNALTTLGERGGSIDSLKQAVTVYNDALKVRTRDTVPLDWAMTQNGLGNTLRILGERQSGTDRLEQAVTAFNDALQVWTRDTVPLDWAATQFNIALVEIALFEKTQQTRYLDHAMHSARLAQEVFVETGAGFYIDQVAKVTAQIDAWRGGLPG